MKPRRVVVTLELETDEPIKKLRNKDNWLDFLENWLEGLKIHQIQVNVVKANK